MDKPLLVVEHLIELRRRILFSLFSIIIFLLIFLPFSDLILNNLLSLAGGKINKLAYFSPEEVINIYWYISLVAAFIVSMPIIVYQVWKFILPALDERYKKMTVFFIFICSFNFIFGVFFAYFLFLPNALKFLLSIGKDNLIAVISATKYIKFVLYIMLVFGLIFEFPILIFFLAKFKIINRTFLKKNFKYIFVAIFIISAIITPTTDIFNMLALSLPLLAIYQISIWIVYFVDKNR